MSPTLNLISPRLKHKIDKYVNIVNALLFAKNSNVFAFHSVEKGRKEN